MKKTAPFRRAASRQRTATEQTLPPPVGGWNTSKSLASMGPTDAVELVNFFPRPTHVETRLGSEQAIQIADESIKTLAVWKGLDGTEKLCVTTGTGFFVYTGTSVTTTDPALARLAVRTNGKHQHDQFGDGTNNWLILVNGVDAPIYYNGSSTVLVTGVTSPALTGITTTAIVGVSVFKERLLFIRNNTLGFDFLPAGAAGGAVSYFDLSSVAELGGFLMAIAVWTRDAGNGPDDYAVFITSQGEALVYAGVDPSSATTWALVGTFRIGKPMGRKCVLKYGSDPLIVTESGVFPLSSLLSAGDAREQYAVSYNIQSEFSAASATTLDTYGWKIVSYPEQDMLLVNVPEREDGPHVQFVMNTISKAWCKFTGWDAEDFVTFDRGLYYCKGEYIYKAWVRTTDEYALLRFVSSTVQRYPVGKSITHTARGAFLDWKSPGLKAPTMFLPLVESQRGIAFSAGIDTDFNLTPFPDPPAYVDSGVARWGSARWGISRWGSSDGITRNWLGAAAWPGRWIAGKLQMQSPVIESPYEVIFGPNEPIGKWFGSVVRYTSGDGV